jgi:hypothetical protein
VLNFTSRAKLFPPTPKAPKTFRPVSTCQHHFIISSTSIRYRLYTPKLPKLCPHSVVGSPSRRLPSLGAFDPEEQELDPEVQGRPPAVQPAMEIGPGYPLQNSPTPYHDRNSVVLLVFPYDAIFDDRLPGLQFFTTSLRGLGYNLVHIHSAELKGFMTVTPFVSQTWPNLAAVVLLDPDFPPPPGPFPRPSVVTTLAAYVYIGGLLIIAGAFQNAFSDPLCFKRFAESGSRKTLVSLGASAHGGSRPVSCAVRTT